MVDSSRCARAALVAAAVMLLPPPLTAQQTGALRKLTDVPPVYPEEAIRGGVQGTVQLRITVGTDGRVSDARVIRSIPQLDANPPDRAGWLSEQQRLTLSGAPRGGGDSRHDVARRAPGLSPSEAGLLHC